MSEEKKKYGAWLKSTGNGDVINFTIEGKKYNMWKNKYKKPESNQPDYQIYEDNYTKPEVTKPIVNDDLEF
jgi:hypothetical protein